MADEINHKLEAISGDLTNVKSVQTGLQKDVHYLSKRISDIADASNKTADAVVKIAGMAEKVDSLDRRLTHEEHKREALENTVNDMLLKQGTQQKQLDGTEDSRKYWAWVVGSLGLVGFGAFIKELINKFTT